MYKTKHFGIWELVPPETLKELGEEKCWELFDEAFLRDIDELYYDLVEEFGITKATVNTWKNGGDKKYSGYRPDGCGVGRQGGSHYKTEKYLCCGLDLTFWIKNKRLAPEEVTDYLQKNYKKYPAIRGVELGVTWNHLDGLPSEAPGRGHPKNKVVFYYASSDLGKSIEKDC